MQMKISPRHGHPTFAYRKQFQKLFDWYARPRPSIEPAYQLVNGMLHQRGWFIMGHGNNWII
jgi:hypothetical protein